MNRIIALVCIFIFWFFLGVFLTFVSQDEVLNQNVAQGQDYNINSSLTDVSSGFNSTSLPNNSTIFMIDTQSTGGTKSALSIMFGFSVPTLYGMPTIIIYAIKALNWILVIITVMLLYKIFNPFAA